MTNEQLYIVIFVPVLFNALLYCLGMAYIEAKFRARERDSWRSERQRR